MAFTLSETNVAFTLPVVFECYW